MTIHPLRPVCEPVVVNYYTLHCIPETLVQTANNNLIRCVNGSHFQRLTE